MSTPANFNGPDAAAVAPALEGSVVQETSSLPGPAAPPRPRRISTTYLLLVVNSLIFSAMLIYNDYTLGKESGDALVFSDFDSALLRAWGSNYGPLTLTGQFWRILTSTFVHLNFLHLAFNMLFLWGLGRYLDRFFTRAQALAIYLLTGAAASMASLIWNPQVNSAGASGAIYGQAGVLIALLCFAQLDLSRRDIRNLLLWIFFSMPIGLLWGHISKRTDYAAHVGGILGGLVIGALLAPSFRPPMERAGRQYGVLRSAAVVLVVLFAIVTQARKDTVSGYLNIENIPWTSHISYSPHPPRVTRVFLDLKGDPKLVRYFSGLLNAELENAGVAVAGSEHGADGVVRAEFKARVEHVSLSMGVVKMYINSQRGLQTIDSCRTLSTGNDNNLYERSAASAVSKIRDRYHDARTVRLDPASNLAASPQFAAEFSSELKTSGLAMVQAGPADIVLHVDLQTQKTPVEENAAVYDIKAVTPDGAPLFESSGTGILSARLAGNAPAACPERLADLEWIYNSTTLPSVAHKVANDLYNPQAAPRPTNPSKPK